MSGARYNNTGKKKTAAFWGISFRLMAIIAASAMILSYIAIYIDPSVFAFPLFFGLYFIPILAINFILLIIALICRSRSAWIPLIVLLPSLLFTELFFKFGGNHTPQNEGIRMKIESYNVGMFSSGKGISRDSCREAIVKSIQNGNPDVACFQEVYVVSRQQIDTLFKNYKYRYYHLFPLRNGALFGNLIISKFPIVSSGKLSFPRSTNLSIYADIDHYGRILRIYDNHLESYNISFTSLIKRLAGRHTGYGEEITNDLKEVHEKVRGTFIRRSDQVNRILENTKSSHYPAIICGDFNDTPMSYAYHKLSRGRKDSFKESGKGFGSTFVHLWPLLRIDYILFPDEFGSISHTTEKLPFSDHYPISAELII